MEIIINSNQDTKITIENNRVIIDSFRKFITKKEELTIKKEVINTKPVEEKPANKKKGRPVEFIYSGNQRKRFDTLAQAADFFNVDPSTIFYAINRKGTFRKIKCRYVDEQKANN